MEDHQIERAVLLGNEAIARGLMEAGCQFLASYPGTPSSEILPAAVRLSQAHNLNLYAEWSTNEKVAFDNAFAASISGKRAACVMKQVGLNVACDSLMSAAYQGTVGGFVIISCDDPGPHSSQTEQDTRLMGLFAKVPVFDPSSPQEALDMVADAFALSEHFHIPAILRPTIRVCHAKQDIPLRPLEAAARTAAFKKDPLRWAATPRYRYVLHKELNRKLEEIEASPWTTRYNLVDGDSTPSEIGIIAGGVPYAHLKDILEETGLKIPVLKVGLPHPLPRRTLEKFCKRYRKVLIIEETGELLELILESRNNVMGRNTGHVPKEGELLPETIYEILRQFLSDESGVVLLAAEDENLEKLLGQVNPAPRRPTLCPGCPHRAAFFAIRKAYSKAIFTSDIGCYTLGLNMGAVDTVLDMGAAITMASGFYHAYHQDGVETSVVATIGDSTFYHSGTPALINAVYNGARFILVILDNKTTAMTGMQPTPGLGIRADGSKGRTIPLERIIRGCGVDFVKHHDPYDVEGLIGLLKEAGEYTHSPEGGVAVIIAEHPCIIGYKSQATERITVTVTEACDGCGLCIKRFECPAFEPVPDEKKVTINQKLCAGCGVCLQICPRQALQKEEHDHGA
jgi:indolepyruvate ferredoxin oxidoreductase alpha subunit